MGFCITQERDSVILSPLIKLPSTQCLSQLSRGFFIRLTMTLPNYITDCAENLMSQRSTRRWTRETPLHGRSSPEKSDCCLFQPLHTQETHPTQKLPHQCLLLGDKVLGRGLVVISIARAVPMPLCPSQQEGSTQGKERKAASSSQSEAWPFAQDPWALWESHFSASVPPFPLLVFSFQILC